jgi:hypothetical protein
MKTSPEDMLRPQTMLRTVAASGSASLASETCDTEIIVIQRAERRPVPAQETLWCHWRTSCEQERLNENLVFGALALAGVVAIILLLI